MAMGEISGRVWKYGNNVNTDFIIPGRYLKLTITEAAAHIMEGIDPNFVRQASPGDVIVGGSNFGCGSSREAAPAALKEFGVSAVVAPFFGRIFYRNAINVGLPVIECAQADEIKQGDQVIIDFERGMIQNLTQERAYKTTALPTHIMTILQAGGLLPHLKQTLARGPESLGKPTASSAKPIESLER